MTEHEREVDSLFLEFQGALAGRYSLERELGRGGMGVVYLAREVRLDRPVAIKLLPPEYSSDPRLRDRFMHEARLAARLSHPYIVPVYSVDEIGGFAFYVMAYVDGETLAQRVAARGPIPAHEATRIFREVAWALAYAHAQGVIHRDIKPANILLERGTHRAMVTDFGIARLTHATGETAVGELLGTPEYMSPEQASGEELDGRSDLYSLGVTGYFALTGALPFTASSAQAVLAQHLTKAPPSLAVTARGVPRTIAQAFDRCLEKDRNARFSTGEALADALAPARDNVSEIPVPVRVFLDRKRILPLVVVPSMLVPLSFGIIASAANGGGPSAMAGALGTVAMIALAAGIPTTILIARVRKLLRLGYGPDDVAAGLRVSMERRQEEFHFEYGTGVSVREKVVRTASIAAVSVGALAIAGAALGAGPEAAGVGIASTYIGVVTGILSAKHRRTRLGRASFLMSFWQGRPGRTLAKIAAFRLGRREAAADRPTEMAIAMSAESLFAAFPKSIRQSLGDVPAVLRDLETRARNIRARIDAIDATALEARHDSRRTVSEERQRALLADLGQSRTQNEKSLADVVTLLENLRLDLLRLRAGAGSAEGITRDVAAARELGANVDRLFEGQREVEEVLRKER